MSEDREQERQGTGDEPSRPTTAAERRERRGAARPTGRTERSARAPKKDAGDPVESKAAIKGRPTPTRDRAERKGSPFKRFGRFIREVVAELRKVIWPTQKQLVTYTLVVLVFVTFMVALVTGLDLAFGRGVLWLFG